MKRFLFGLGPLLALSTQMTMAQTTIQTLNQVVPATCISSKFSAQGDNHWKNMTLTLTNNCNQTVDFQNATVTFKNNSALNTNFWGDFSPLPYPDNSLMITSQQDADGKFLSSLHLHFPTYPGADTKLPNGRSIAIKYGVSSDTHREGTTNVYLQTGGDTGSILLHNSAKPANVNQNYALVHLLMNGQNVKDLQLPWAASFAVQRLAVGSYSLAPDNITDSSGSVYQGEAQPSTVNVTANQQASSTITYSLAPQTGKLSIKLPALPPELTGYSESPTVLVRDIQMGSSISKLLSWNNTVTIADLKAGSIYNFSTPVINYNNYRCTPTFNPATLTASSTTPATSLTYNCVETSQVAVSLQIRGAPANLSSLKVTLQPNDGSTAVQQTVSLADGTGNATVTLNEGVIYTVASQDVPGYSITFSPQPFTATNDAVETITLTSVNQGTPVAVNGQLTVCGTQLCNQHGTPIQLKGMSTHGLQWYGQGKCITSGSLDALVNNFKANVIRLALYVQEGGYETNPAAFTEQVSRLINEAYNRGIYVIVDWHILNPGDPNYNLNLARQFFTNIANLHKDKNNLIYEIANEPNGVSWAAIKNYADQIIPVIRSIDNNAPIIIGTRGWSSLGVSDGSGFQEITANPVNFPNIMYAFHFYAASHRDNYLQALDNAAKVLPIFVTEFATQTYSGDGDNDFAMADRYMQLMATRKIGWANWNYSDDFRSGAVWKTNTCSSGVWVDSNLKEAGVYIKDKIINP
ncbi:glycoside hydrolase family 5 protein [Legionella fairfieldensis]|uniref:glycoside hydrolase family 5 protein n=1 Tax=Legionella fairfieldensis TaxID=45064 RepID=UPI000AA0E033|nr:glycoside hydrolase family 5 protein [Legionella fairfieldensis]